MKKRFLMIAILFVLAPMSRAMVVHDAVAYAGQIIKSANDKIYQTLKLDYSAKDVGLQTDQLTKLKESLKTAQESYKTLKESYEKLTFIKDNIGDPMKIASFINKEFTKSDDLESCIKITKKVMNAEYSDIDENFLENIVKEADKVVGGDIHLTEAKLAVEQERRAKVVDEACDNLVKKVKEKMSGLSQEDKRLNARESSLNEMTYANYKTSVFIADLLAQQMAANAQYQKMVGEKIRQEGAERVKANNRSAQIVTAEAAAAKGTEKYFKQKSSKERIDELFKDNKCRAF